jgi:ribonuclease HI
MKDYIIIYTDGASRGNPGPGGWGAVIIEGNNIKEIGGGETRTTNNKMELSAAIGALSETSKDIKIKLYTDSQYVINGITKWINGWLANDWKTKEKKDVLNKDLWQKLHKLNIDREIEWKRVKGHAGVPGNERCDEIATAIAGGEKPILYSGDRRNCDIDFTEPSEEELAEHSDRERKSAKAYSYLSLVGGKLEKHSDWASCKDRVNGVAGAKFRKSISIEDEAEIIKSWGI